MIEMSTRIYYFTLITKNEPKIQNEKREIEDKKYAKCHAKNHHFY